MKTSSLFICLSIALFSCEKSNNQVSHNQAIIKQLYEHFNKHDWQKMAEMYADTTDFKDPSFGTEMITQTHQQTIQKYSEMEKMFPNIKDEVVQMYDSGNNVVIVEFISTGTAPDGTKFKIPICSIYTIENGKIKKDFTYYDNSGK